MAKEKDNKNVAMVVCGTCINYYITYDQSAPYGCRALGFKSRKNPAAVVYEASGIHCQLYVSRDRTSSGGTDGSVIA